MDKIITLPCGCQRKLEPIEVDGTTYDVQIFGRTPDKNPLSEKDRLAIARIIKESLKEKG